MSSRGTAAAHQSPVSPHWHFCVPHQRAPLSTIVRPFYSVYYAVRSEQNDCAEHFRRWVDTTRRNSTLKLFCTGVVGLLEPGCTTDDNINFPIIFFGTTFSTMFHLYHLLWPVAFAQLLSTTHNLARHASHVTGEGWNGEADQATRRIGYSSDCNIRDRR